MTQQPEWNQSGQRSNRYGSTQQGGSNGNAQPQQTYGQSSNIQPAQNRPRFGQTQAPRSAAPRQDPPQQNQQSQYGQNYQRNQPEPPQQQEEYRNAALNPNPERNPASGNEPKKQKHGTGIVLTAALVAALVGGGVGAGVGGAIASSSSASSENNNAPGPAGTTSSGIKESTDPTVITETSKKVLPSTVTVRASSSSSDKRVGTGTGEVLDTQGHIMTNYHVVSEQNKDLGYFEVRFTDGTVRKATLVGGDATADIAVLKLDNTSGITLTPITFGDSSKLVSGDSVLAIGSPYSQENSVTAGIVSNTTRVREALKGGEYIPMIQTDAAINHGNSGGPLVNTRGELVGVNAQGFLNDEGTLSAGIGFAIPSNYAKRVADEIIEKRKATHGYLGAGVKDAPSQSGSGEAALFKGGAEITDVSSGDAAEKAGLQKGDVVIEVDERRVDNAEDLNGIVRAQAANSTATFKIRRGSETKDVQVTFGDADAKRK